MPDYIVKIQETTQAEYRVKARSKSDAIFAVATQAAEVEHLTTVSIARKVFAGTVDPKLDLDGEIDFTTDVAADVAQALAEAEDVNSGELTTMSPRQKRAAQ